MVPNPAEHYDNVTASWRLLLGDEFHYGVFERGDEQLRFATGRLTELMIEAIDISADDYLLDVGCGIGTSSCRVAGETGARVIGISTSIFGITAARTLARRLGLSGRVSFEIRDGMENGFGDRSFSRVWALESSHLMRDRGKLISEMSRVLVPGGRLALCDIVRRRPIDLQEVRLLREELVLLRNVFGDARMDPLPSYRRLIEEHGLVVDREDDLTAKTEQTFSHWRENARLHRDETVALVGERYLEAFVAACDILERLWSEGLFGYGLLSAWKPLEPAGD